VRGPEGCSFAHLCRPRGIGWKGYYTAEHNYLAGKRKGPGDGGSGDDDYWPD